MFPKPANNIPIIGQPFTLKSWTANVLIVCNCPAKEPVILTGDAMAQCPACQRTFQVQGMVIDPRTGQINFQIAMHAKTETKAE